VEVNDPNGGYGQVCEGDRACVGVSHGMVDVRLLSIRRLSPFLRNCNYFFSKLILVSVKYKAFHLLIFRCLSPKLRGVFNKFPD